VQWQTFQTEILEIKYNEKNISEVLEMTVDDAISFFSAERPSNTEKKIVQKLIPLSDVGWDMFTRTGLQHFERR